MGISQTAIATSLLPSLSQFIPLESGTGHEVENQGSLSRAATITTLVLRKEGFDDESSNAGQNKAKHPFQQLQFSIEFQPKLL